MGKAYKQSRSVSRLYESAAPERTGHLVWIMRCILLAMVCNIFAMNTACLNWLLSLGVRWKSREIVQKKGVEGVSVSVHIFGLED